ncbi:TadE/TadG family type IV pilus assembly protein [Planctomycetaceae bacterium SH139]
MMQQNRKREQRSGAAVVELAVCLPLLVLISLATIEACAMIYLKQSLKIAAYEGARVGIVPGADPTNVLAQSDLILVNRDIADYGVTLARADPRSLQPGDFFRVSVSAPCTPNSLIGGWFYDDRQFTESVEVMAE